MRAPAATFRRWGWPRVLDYGFRPFFLLAPAWAILSAAAVVIAPTFGVALGPWHAYEMIFGFGGAVLAGFVLTAVPNWTGRLPLDNGPLLGLVALWVLGRVGNMIGAPMLDLIFLPALMVAIAVPLFSARRWRAFRVAAALPVLWLAQVGLMADDILPFIDRYQLALAGYGWLIATVGGRLLAHLASQRDSEPPPHGGLDTISLALLLPGLASWTVEEPQWYASLLMAAAGMSVLLRQWRWRPWRIGQPVTVALNLAYTVLGLSLCLAAAGAPASLVTHLFSLCAMSLAMMAVMARTVARFAQAPVWAGQGLVLIATAGLMRAAAQLLPDLHVALVALSGLCWVLAHGSFIYRHGTYLINLSPPGAKRA